MQRFSLYGVHKRDYRESVTIGQTDARTHARTHRQTPDKVIPMCRYASQATQKRTCAFCDIFALECFVLFFLIQQHRVASALGSVTREHVTKSFTFMGTSAPYWEVFIFAKGVYRVSIVKRPLFSTLSYVFAFYDFIK